MLLLLPGVSSRPVDTGLLLLFFQTQRAYCCRPIAVLATSTMGVRGGILLGTLVLMGFFVSEKTDAPKDDSSRLHQLLFQGLHSCIHWNFLTCWRFFISSQQFFWTVPPRKIKARAPCLLSKSIPFEKQDIFHAVCHQPERHEAVAQCAWCLGAERDTQDQQDIL